jgi:hypothetical protein
MRIKSILLSIFAVTSLAATVADAAPILIANGGFESVTNGGNKQLSSTVTNANDRATITGWTSSNGNDGGYNFVLDSSLAATSKSAIWLEGNKNGFSASPDGGNFFASDPLYYPGTLAQSVYGLTIGTSYTLTFYYALAQQVGYTGANSGDYWQVGFGNDTQNTAKLSIDDDGFSGWKKASMTFIASSLSESLSFLAKSGPDGAPPFMLLDGVSMTATNAVPEPATWSIFLGGLIAMGFLARRRHARRT